MVSAQPPPPTGDHSLPVATRSTGSPWRRALLIGLCFGMGYGITHRLLGFPNRKGPGTVQSFGVKAFPGTSLDSLRQKHGSSGQSIRADLDRIDAERQNIKEQKEGEKHQAALLQREREDRERLEREADRLRLETLNQPQNNTPSVPEANTVVKPLAPPVPFPPPPPPPPLPEATPTPQP